MAKPLNISILVANLIMLLLANANAADFRSLSGRTGVITANYTGGSLAAGSFFSMITAEAEAILTQSERQNLVITGAVALDGVDTRTRYFYAGIGQRFFLNGVQETQSTSHPDAMMIYAPRLLWYAGWDAGLAQILLLSFGDVLGSYSTTAEAGATFGFRRQFSSSLYFDGRIGASLGTSISNTPVTSQVFRGLVGLVYYF